jgi:hypothetical protein
MSHRSDTDAPTVSSPTNSPSRSGSARRTSPRCAVARRGPTSIEHAVGLLEESTTNAWRGSECVRVTGDATDSLAIEGQHPARDDVSIKRGGVECNEFHPTSRHHVRNVSGSAPSPRCHRSAARVCGPSDATMDQSHLRLNTTEVLRNQPPNDQLRRVAASPLECASFPSGSRT